MTTPTPAGGPPPPEGGGDFLGEAHPHPTGSMWLGHNPTITYLLRKYATATMQLECDRLWQL